MFKPGFVTWPRSTVCPKSTATASWWTARPCAWWPWTCSASACLSVAKCSTKSSSSDCPWQCITAARRTQTSSTPSAHYSKWHPDKMEEELKKKIHVLQWLNNLILNLLVQFRRAFSGKSNFIFLYSPLKSVFLHINFFFFIHHFNIYFLKHEFPECRSDDSLNQIRSELL